MVLLGESGQRRPSVWAFWVHSGGVTEGEKLPVAREKRREPIVLSLARVW